MGSGALAQAATDYAAGNTKMWVLSSLNGF
jgi:hypothetical protein